MVGQGEWSLPEINQENQGEEKSEMGEK